MIIELDINITSLQEYLNAMKWIDSSETITHTTSPGEGNMNVVVRVHTNQRTFILKQSRPYVRKYPDLAAPIERIDTEYQWYTSISTQGSMEFAPSVLHYSKEDNLLMIEDIGESEDLSTLYGERKISPNILTQLSEALDEIHGSKIQKDFPTNIPLRTLNHQHIFVLPFMEENGFELDDIQAGLQELSVTYKQDEKLKSVVSKLGVQYLSQGNTLLHGDYYPGSWIKAKERIYIIDPEFSYVGIPEFDLGVMAAHLIIITGDHGYVQVICGQYSGTCDTKLVEQYAGVEIMRRIIGLAQLPLARSLEEKSKLLHTARAMILE